MTTKDIMIGDWVNIAYTKHDGTPVSKNFQVSEIQGQYAWSAQGGNMGNRLNPIKLTAEILMKNDAQVVKTSFQGDIRSYTDKRGWHVRKEKPIWVKALRLHSAGSVFDDWVEEITLCAVDEEGQAQPYDEITPLCFICRELHYIPIEYVHELQHVLRVFDMGKLADDFKI